MLFRSVPTGLPVRTASSYLEALRRFHQRFDSEVRAAVDPYEEEWRPTFAVIETGARVDPTAELLDSVALHDGVVGPGATVARSIICPGGVVAPRQSVLGQIVA